MRSARCSCMAYGLQPATRRRRTPRETDEAVNRELVGKPAMNEFVIEAGTVGRQYWRDLWRYRELFYFLAWRDFLVRYKQTVVGVAWSLIRPLLTMLILTLVFGKI